MASQVANPNASPSFFLSFFLSLCPTLTRLTVFLARAESLKVVMVQLLQHSHLHTVFAAATTTIGVGQFPRRRAKFPTSLVLLPRCTSSSSSSGTSYIASTYLSLPRLIHSYDHFFLRIPSPLLASSSICTFAISHPIGSDWIHTKIPITAGRAPNPTIPPRFQFLPSCKFKGFLSSFPFHCSFIFLSELTPTVVILMDADSIFFVF